MRLPLLRSFGGARSAGFVVFMRLFLLLLLAACGGKAQQAKEYSPTACQDGADNDGDGYVDCNDQDCRAFTVCYDAGADTDSDVDADTDGDADTDSSTATDTGEPGCLGADWVTEVVPDRDSGGRASMVIDGDGN